MADVKIVIDTTDVKKANAETKELKRTYTALDKAMKPLIAKEKAFAQTVRAVNDAMRLGLKTNKEAIADIQKLGKAYGYTETQINRVTASMSGVRKNTNRMNATIQNAGYQFGDFFVQVQSGQNILVAFSQQGAQLAGLLPGLAGAVTGVGLVIGSMLVRALMDGSSFMKGFGQAIEEITEKLGKFEQSFKRVSEGFRDELGPEVEKFAKVILQKDLRDATKALEKDMGSFGGYFSKLGGQIRATAQEVKVLKGAYKSAEAAQAAIKLDKLEGIRDTIQGIGDIDPTNAEELRAAIDAIGSIIEQDLAGGLELGKGEMKSLVDLGEALKSVLDTITPEQKEQTKEVEKQRDFLIEIVRLEEARDRINQSLEQKFANSTRRLELLKSGMSVGQAGKAISMENMIADAVAAERALQSQLMNPLELQKYMGDFENALKVRLSGFNDEQVAAEELLKARRELAKVTKETEPASIYGQAIGPVKPDPSSRGGFDITSAAEQNRKQIERQIELAGLLSDSFLGAFRDIASGTETASDAFKKMSIAIVEHILEILIWKPLIESLTNALSPTAVGGSAVGGLLGNLFPAANGAAINNGNVVPFAYGGVVNSPTLFGMSGGRTGLMGEAGPEAILPLKRGAGGKLGVEGGGNVTVHQSFNFAANGDESVKKIIAEAAPGIAKMTEAQIVNSRQRGGQMRRVFS